MLSRIEIYFRQINFDHRHDSFVVTVGTRRRTWDISEKPLKFYSTLVHVLVLLNICLYHEMRKFMIGRSKICVRRFHRTEGYTYKRGLASPHVNFTLKKVTHALTHSLTHTRSRFNASRCNTSIFKINDDSLDIPWHLDVRRTRIDAAYIRHFVSTEAIIYRFLSFLFNFYFFPLSFSLFLYSFFLFFRFK